ncbi:transcriptional regulator, LysR family [Aquitalea magnusonii]|uniref:Transcriptional regulator, LysR family n=1 Tax=Aquitalea magnusonii TaxID=332411 RepID=A0A3G9GBQ1_9NEIS|nr:LysR family transcriptional regulator [Aquitalea magnusonii]BBF85310.1 transcriptional regulator, LysR family [Aquitalea magnusonii]
MTRIDYNSLHTFLLVARERSFTRAAAQLGVSQSALSHSIRVLEARLGLRLLTRNTRGVSPSEAGEHLLARIADSYDNIEFALAALSEMKEKPSGTVRITTHDHAADSVLWPRLRPLLRDYPDIRLELDINYALVDIVAERFDAGVRSGGQVAGDMIATRIGPDYRMAVVGAPSYLAGRRPPQLPQELSTHRCINLRLPTHGGLYAWEFMQDGKMVETRVDGQLVFNTSGQMLTAALDGYGLAYLPEDMVQDGLRSGRLCAVLQAFWPRLTGYHLYYPHRRQPSPAFALVLDTLRYRDGVTAAAAGWTAGGR